jgi:hypothetical protein
MGWTQISGVAAGALVAAAWEGLVLAGVVAVCLRMLPGMTAAARSLVWTIVMLAVCGLPFVHFGSVEAGSRASGQVLLDERIGLALVLVWAAISLVRAGQLVRSAVWLRGISRRAVAISGWNGATKDNYGDSGFARMTDVSGMASVAGRAAELCVSDEVDRPCVVGFFRPRILVPAELFERISEGELRQIVLHEMEHLRRRDDWTNLLQKLSLVVFPLNPALIWIERQLCVERELACDDQVLKATGARKAYAACLANLAEHSLVRRGVSLALGAWERQSEVVRRVHRILSRNEREMGRRQVAGVVAVMMLGVAGVADGLAHVPALVGFGPGVVAVAAADGAGAKAPVYRESEFVGINPHANPEVRVRATDVVFHPAAPVKAKHRAGARKASIPMVDAVKLTSNMGHPERRAENEPMVVMVTWTAAAQPVIVQDLQFTYAAVPTRNGWLFVQL